MCTLLEDLGLVCRLAERLRHAADPIAACRSVVELLFESRRADAVAYVSVDAALGRARLEASAPATNGPLDLRLDALPFRQALTGPAPIVLRDARVLGSLSAGAGGGPEGVWVVAALRVPDAPAGLLLMRGGSDPASVAEIRRLLAVLAGVETLSPGTVESSLAHLGEDERVQLLALAAAVSPSPQALSDLVANFLYLVAADRGTALPHREPIELLGLACDAVDLFAPVPTGRRLAVEVHGRRVRMRADRTHLTRAIGNLVRNAITYTPDTGHVDVRVASDGDDAVLVVADSGCGLAPDAVDQLGTRFARFHPHLAVPGAGLGLAAARAIAAAHRGRLDAHSTPGRGSAFTLRLPRNG